MVDLGAGGADMSVMTVGDIKGHDGDIYKFVRVGAEFRYCVLSSHGLQHRDLVKPGEKAVAAGSFFLFRPDKWKMSQPYSTTLSLGCSEEHEKALSEELSSIGFSQKPGDMYH
jgi:hypothetical protein